MQVKLTVIQGPHTGKQFLFDQHENFLVGRGPQAHFQLPKLDKLLSRMQFMVEVNPPHCRLVDLNSRNGTRVNNKKVPQADLKDGDLIRAGKSVIQVSILELELPKSPKTLTPAKLKPQHFEDIQPIELDAVKSDANEDPEEDLPADYERLIKLNKQPIQGFDIVEKIGWGGMGEVFLAIRKSDRKVLAIKTIRPQVAGSNEAVQRFLREARILESLRHPHIVAFGEMGLCGGLLYFAMEYVRGKNAKQLVAETGPMKVSRAVKVVNQLLKGLEYAHGRQCVHRDIKPSNLLVGEEQKRDCVKLSDFGLARTYQATTMSGLTVTGDVAGSVPFMAPEQIVNFRGAKPSVDQYGAAATLYYMLTGKYVFDFPKGTSTRLKMILQDDPVPIQERRAEIPKRLAACTHRALAVKPENRFENIAAFRKALKACFR